MADLPAHRAAADGTCAGGSGRLFGCLALERFPVAVGRAVAPRGLYPAGRAEPLARPLAGRRAAATVGGAGAASARTRPACPGKGDAWPAPAAFTPRPGRNTRASGRHGGFGRGAGGRKRHPRNARGRRAGAGRAAQGSRGCGAATPSNSASTPPTCMSSGPMAGERRKPPDAVPKTPAARWLSSWPKYPTGVWGCETPTASAQKSLSTKA